MPKKELALRFDYSDLPPDCKGKLINISGRIHHGVHDHVSKILEIGGLVQAAHDLLSTAGRAGKFRAWVEAECGFTERTARYYSAAFRCFGLNVETISTLTPGAVYALSAPSAPSEAVDVAYKLVKQGKPVDEAQAKAIIATFKKPTKAEPSTNSEARKPAATESKPEKPAKPPKPGKAVGETKAALFKAFRDAMGALSKANDALAVKYGKLTHYKTIDRLADQIDKSARQWEEDV